MLEEERKKFVNKISDEIKAAIVKAAEGVQKKNQIKTKRSLPKSSRTYKLKTVKAMMRLRL